MLLHGWGLNVRVWDGLVEELRDRFRMIAVDLPGHGRSPWTPGRNTPAEQAWLLHSTLAPISNRYSLLGWSLGGQIALDLAAAMPARIDKLVLVATTPRFTVAPDWPYGMKADAITKMATQLREDYQQTVRDFLDLQVRGSIEGASVIEQLRNALFVHGEAKPEALESGLEHVGHQRSATDASARADTDISHRGSKRQDHRTGAHRASWQSHSQTRDTWKCAAPPTRPFSLTERNSRQYSSDFCAPMRRKSARCRP